MTAFADMFAEFDRSDAERAKDGVHTPRIDQESEDIATHYDRAAWYDLNA